MGDFPSHLVRAPARPRYGRAKATTVWLVTVGACLLLTGANAAPVVRGAGSSIDGLAAIGSPPDGPSWAPAPVSTGGLHTLATAGRGRYALHTIGGTVTFLPGVDLGATVPGYQPGELPVTADRYRSWFAAMSWLGLRVVRVYTIHPPAFYRELAAHNAADPDRPLYLMQGVYPPATAVQDEIRDAAGAVSGDLTRAPRAGRAGGTWTADVTAWLIGWIVGAEPSPAAAVPATRGRYVRGTAAATPAERRLAARMDELATLEAARGLSQPIAFADAPGSGLDPGHIRATADWPAGTFAAHSAYPYDPATLRHATPGADPYAGYLAFLKRRHGELPTVVSEFGVSSSLGSAGGGPLGRSAGDHDEQQAMAVDARLLRLIRDGGLAGGFLSGWTDEWYRSSWNTVRHQAGDRRQLWHDPLTSGQHTGLIATDAAGAPDAQPVYLVDDEHAWPARRLTARVDESYVWLRVTLGDPQPATVTLGFDVLPALLGAPPPGSGDQWADAAFSLDLTARTGQAYIRDRLDPMALGPAVARGPAPAGWRRFELLTGPADVQNAGALRHGPFDADSRSLWRLTAGELTVRVPWAMLGYADPSMHEAGVPLARAAGQVVLTTQISPGVGVTVSASGTDQQAGEVTWINWNRPFFTERLKAGATAVRDAAVDVTRVP